MWGNLHIKKRHCKNNGIIKVHKLVLRIPELYKEKSQQLSGPSTPAVCGETVSFCKELQI